MTSGSRVTAAGRKPRSVLLIMAVALSVVLSGCVSIPTSGQVEQVEQVRPAPNDRSEVVPKPPVTDGPPRLIVEGFLLAMTRYEPNYDVARQFLTSQTREAWRPEDKVTIFDNRQLITTDTSASLSATRTGVLGPDGAYQVSSGTFTQDFGMVKQNGQWRISKPPDGLLISEVSFATAYTPFDLYFYDPTFTALVPDPIYLPTEGRIEASLVQALLNGPSAWLKPAVTTAFPPKTTLNTNAVPVVNGLAQISLNDALSGLNDDQRSNLVAQLTWTLRQQSGIRGVQLTVNNEPFTVRDQITEDGQTYVPIDAGTQKSPISPQTSTVLIGMAGRDVVTVDDAGDRVKLAPVPGPFGKGAFAVDSVASSTTGQTLAAVTDGGTVLRRGGFSAVTPQIVLDHVTGLLRPQFTRYNELWAAGEKDGRTELWVIKNATATMVSPKWPADLEVSAFRISPDGSRVAVVGRLHGADMIGLATIARGDRLTVGPLRTVQLTDPSSAILHKIVDVGWIAPTELMVLASTGDGAPVEPYRVEQDGSQVDRVGSTDDWQATSLATAVDPAPAFRAVVAGQNGSWQYQNSGDLWLPLAGKLRDPAYPG